MIPEKMVQNEIGQLWVRVTERKFPLKVRPNR